MKPGRRKDERKTLLPSPSIKVAVPEVVSGVPGYSESKIMDMFEQAAASAPCVLFIDEIDSISPKRENVQKEMERRIVAHLHGRAGEEGVSGRGDAWVRGSRSLFSGQGGGYIRGKHLRRDL